MWMTKPCPCRKGRPHTLEPRPLSCQELIMQKPQGAGPASLIMQKPTSSACRAWAVTTRTLSPPCRPRPQTARPFRSCHGNGSSSKRSSERASSERWTLPLIHSQGATQDLVTCLSRLNINVLSLNLAMLLCPFSKVHLCEIENPQDLANLEFPFNVRKGRPLLVAVKILRPDASKNARLANTTDHVPKWQNVCRHLFIMPN